MDTCPCGSERPFADCCQPIIDGSREPDTAEATMRARYSAYVTGAIDFLVDSNHPETRDEVNREEVERWSRSSEWLGLRIVATEDGGPDDDEGVVRFRVRYRMDGQLHVHRERATFRRSDGVWKFHTAEEDSDDERELVPVVPRSEQVGRNDPCPCGSGKKYKKCHGAASAS